MGEDPCGYRTLLFDSQCQFERRHKRRSRRYSGFAAMARIAATSSLLTEAEFYTLLRSPAPERIEIESLSFAYRCQG